MLNIHVGYSDEQHHYCLSTWTSDNSGKSILSTVVWLTQEQLDTLKQHIMQAESAAKEHAC